MRSFEKEMEGKRVFSLAKPLAAAGWALEKRRGPCRALGILQPMTLWKRLGQLPFPLFLC